MAYSIQYDPEALADLAQHRRDASMLRQQINERLRGEPLRDTTNNGPMRPNLFGAERRLRIDPFRVLYAVLEQEEIVYVLAICRKDRNRVYHRGQEIELDV